MKPVALALFNHNRKEELVRWLRECSFEQPERFEILILNHGCVSDQRIVRLSFDPPAPLSVFFHDKRLSFPSRVNYLLRVGKRLEWVVFWQWMKQFDERYYLKWVQQHGKQKRVGLGGMKEFSNTGIYHIANSDLGEGTMLRFDGAIVRPSVVSQVGWLDERFYTVDAWVEWQHRLSRVGFLAKDGDFMSKRMLWVHPLATYFLVRNWFLFLRFGQVGWRGRLVTLFEWLKEVGLLLAKRRFERLRLFWGGTVDGWRVWRE